MQAESHREQHDDETGRRLHDKESDVPQLVSEIQDHGFVVVPDVLSPGELEAMRSAALGLMGPRGRNSFEGFATQRVYGVMARTDALDALVEHPLVLDVIDRFLEPNYLLSQLVAINIEPDEAAQMLHHDDVLYSIPRPRPAVSIATMWALDDFTAENGGTLVIPGSHLWDDRTPEPHEVESAVPSVMSAGSVMFFIGTLWHGGGANNSSKARLGVTAQYCQPWARTVENFSLSMDRRRVAEASERLQSLLGYSIHSTLMGYVDGRHPKRLLTSS